MLRAFSFGGGVQSTAALVLAASGQLDYPLFLFSNVGDDSENPATLAYVREVALPFATRYNLELIELREERTLYRDLMRPESRSIGIPVRLAGSGAPGRRRCTHDYKIRRVRAELVRRGATANVPALLGLGISLDEYQRMRSDSPFPEYRMEYPLIDRRLSRMDCISIIERSGLPIPQKSACFFCPFHRLSEWTTMRRERPDLFERAAALEQTLSDRAETLGRGKVFLSSRLVPLEQAIGHQADMFDDDTCESGFCMT